MSRLFRAMLGSLWNRFRVSLGSLWGHYGITQQSFWSHFGIFKDLFSTYFLVVSTQCVIIFSIVSFHLLQFFANLCYPILSDFCLLTTRTTQVSRCPFVDNDEIDAAVCHKEVLREHLLRTLWHISAPPAIGKSRLDISLFCFFGRPPPIRVGSARVLYLRWENLS